MLYIIPILALLLILAVFWEYKDYALLHSKPNVWEITDQRKKEKEYVFYGTFNYRNNISWRSIYIQSVLAILLLVFAYNTYHKNNPMTLSMAVLFFAIIFLCAYGMNQFRTFHLYRNMASKLSEEINVL